ncbi:hypothetical protein IPZ58_25125 [Streptomyces roseoverticillatus]|uniref:hypothetical protein n=1 Tax=Streptomyces roseoverticillatus TaxID=66429 RepID=UPI001F186C1C|nr:hypothetical protein [Streptomyces roseoverticillatus]MCF3104849.1 hypothetical protein [Streptomyces roseoverticillatus]
MGTMAAVVACTPGLTRRILHDDRTFDKGGPLYERLREVLGDGLGCCSHSQHSQHSQHRRQRRLCQPAFHPARLSHYAPVMARRTAATAGAWSDGQEIDVHAEMTRGVIPGDEPGPRQLGGFDRPVGFR